jgi:hypothetical protein
MRRLPALSEAQIATITVFVRKLADQLGHPTDLEGGWAGDCLHVFQARPITTLGAPAT